MTSSHVGVPSTWKSERRGASLGLSLRMKGVLTGSVHARCIAPGGVSTRQALARRDLCDLYGTLTPFGYITAVSLIPLAEQCRALGLALEERQHAWRGCPESAAVALLSPKPRWAFADEGRMLHGLIHALVLPRLYSVASAAWNEAAGYDRARSWLYGHYAAYRELLDIEPGLVDAMLGDIHCCNRVQFMQSWRMLGDWNSSPSSHPAASVRPEDALAILDGVGESRLSAIASRVFSEPYAYFTGWPDIMLLDAAGNLRFVEVKTTDTLHFGQIITITDMREAAGLDISVTRLVRTRRSSQKAYREIKQERT